MPTSRTWHPGEVSIQAKSGSQQRMAQIGSKLIRTFMPDQHREFFAQQPLIILGAEDKTGEIWATALFGEPGFISTPDSQTMLINAAFTPTDPLAGHIGAGNRLGLLGIDLATKRRNRLNAVVTSISEKQIVVAVLQSFGNCPKYIQVKQATENPHYSQPVRRDITSLDKTDSALIRQADTFFIASGFKDGSQDNNRGLDVSHRGGETGFIRIDDEGRLLVPDYSGNGFFNTLGNLQINPQAGLLLFDFQKGHSLHLSVKAEILWQLDEPELCGEEDRLLRFTINKGCKISNTLPLLFESCEQDFSSSSSR